MKKKFEIIFEKTNLSDDLNALWHQEGQHLDQCEELVLDPWTPSGPVREDLHVIP